MKPVPFDYARPTELAEALDLLAEHGERARVLAGGQSLVPQLATREVRPALVVDINRVASCGIRLWPPASTRVRPPCSASRSRASASSVGRA